MKKKAVTGFLATILAVVISFLLITSGAILYWFYDQDDKRPATNSTSSFFSPSPQPIPTSSPLPTPNPTELLTQIDPVFRQQNPKLNNQLQLFLNRQSGNYASGSYQTAEPFESGWWLAAKISDQWQIIASGNGNILCQNIEGYNFPISIVPECYDQNTGNIIDRATEITVVIGAVDATGSPTP